VAVAPLLAVGTKSLSKLVGAKRREPAIELGLWSNAPVKRRIRGGKTSGRLA